MKYLTGALKPVPRAFIDAESCIFPKYDFSIYFSEYNYMNNVFFLGRREAIGTAFCHFPQRWEALQPVHNLCINWQ